MNILLKNSIYLVSMQMVNYIVPLITLPYLTRHIGFYNYGVLSTAINIIFYVILVVDFGFNLSATREVSKYKNNKSKISKIYTDVIFAKVILFFISMSLVSVIIESIPTYEKITELVYLMVPQVISSILFPIWLYQGLEKISYAALLNMIGKILTIPLLVLFVNSSNDIDRAAIIMSWSTLVPLVIFFIKSKLPEIIFDFRRFKYGYIKESITSSSTIFMGTIAVSAYTLSTPIILSFVNDFTQVGYFVAADKIRGAFIGVFLIIGQAIYPRANILYSENKKKYYSFVRKLIKWQIILCSLASIAFYFIMPVLAPLILGAEYSNSAELSIIIKLMSPMIVLIPLSVILANCVLLPQRKNKEYALIPIASVVIHFTYTFFLCAKWGALGASYAILVTEIVSCLLLIFTTIRKNLLDENLK